MYANKRDKFDLNVMNARVKVEAIDFNHNVNNPANIRLGQDQYIRVGYTSSRRLQDVFETSWSRPIYSSLLYVFKTSCKKVFKTSSRSFEDVFKTSSRHLQDVFKTYHEVKLFLLTRL